MKQLQFMLLSVLISIVTITVAQADTDGYLYSKDLSFFDTLFMSESLPTVDDPTVKQICVGCHWTMLPGLLPARSWEKIMNGLDDHFGKKLEMSDELQRYILQYLKENAAEYTESETSVKLLDSIGGRTPIQLSDSKFFEKKHHEISQSDWNHKKVVYKSNCVACHIELAETGSFDEVEKPGN